MTRSTLNMAVAVSNAPLMMGLCTVLLSKLLCLGIGNACKTGTALIPIFIVSGLCGLLLSAAYVVRSWRNRTASLQKNLVIAALQSLSLLLIFYFKMEIP